MRPAARGGGARRVERRWGGSVVLVFLSLQFLCQLALLSGSLGGLRVAFRIAAFGVSIALMVLPWKGGPKHPAVIAVRWMLAILCVSVLHPTTNNLLAGLAHVALNVAIVGPLFWVPRLRPDSKLLRRMVVLLFLFNAASAMVGVLQVYFPGRFEASVSAAIAGQEDYVRSLQLTLANGERVFRPMGLTDVPGGAASAGFFVVLLGSGFLIASRRWLTMAVSAGLMFLGIFCLYLSQVRATMVILVIALLVLAGLLALGGHVRRLVRLSAVVGLCALGGLGWAISVGGDAAMKKWSALFADEPSNVYYSNRGRFLEHTLEEVLPEYPLGAGLGRWGMMYSYFGEEGDPERGPLWAEIQWTAWLYDGGVPLTLAYVAAILLALWWAFRITRDPLARRSDLWLWASVVFAYDVGALALTFSYPLFIGQSGLEFWVLNAVLFNTFVSAHTEARRAAVAVPSSAPAPAGARP